MRIILLRDIPALGRKSDVKEVSDGHARNFLFPRGLAVPATPQALKELAVTKAVRAEEEANLIKELEKLADLLKDRTITFSVKADDSGAVFGSITKDMILKALRGHKLITKERVEIKLDHPLKQLGEYIVDVDLKKGITSKLKVILQKQP